MPDRTRLISLLLVLLFIPLLVFAEELPAAALPDDVIATDTDFAASPPDWQGTLTESAFTADDLPDSYLQPCVQAGRVERIRYTTTDGDPQTKYVYIYLPAEYDENPDRQYNIMYLLHASGGSPKNYISTEKATSFQCLLDNMIALGRLEPLIVVAPTYYPPDDEWISHMPLFEQVKVTATFPRELVEDIVPAVEGQYRTYAESTDAAGLLASRDHRAVAGFSLGGTAVWYVLAQRMDAFRWFLPISEASWDDGEGGITGIRDSELSSQALYEAILTQGFGRNDFRLYFATGTDDEAFSISTAQMESLLSYTDFFILGRNTSCSMMFGGTHTLAAVYVYMFHILPALFQ